MSTSYKSQVDTLIERFGFTFLKKEINSVADVKSRSIEQLRMDILNLIENNIEVKEKVESLGLLSIQNGNRQVEVYSLNNDSDKQKLKLLIENLDVSFDSIIYKSFPFPVESSNLTDGFKMDTIYPILSDEIEISGDRYYRIVVSSFVDKEVDEPVPEEYLSDKAKLNAVYMMKRTIRTQLFHVIYWNYEESQLIISVDKNKLSIFLSQEQLFIMRNFLMRNGVDCGTAINVFGAISPLYDADDGYITHIGHVTTDGNPVRIPLKNKGECLKKDHYHQAGEGGGFVHAKFMIEKKWKLGVIDSTKTVDVEVGLMGQAKMLDTQQPLSDFSVNSVKRLEDFRFAIKKVLSLIPQ